MTYDPRFDPLTHGYDAALSAAVAEIEQLRPPPTPQAAQVGLQAAYAASREDWRHRVQNWLDERELPGSPDTRLQDSPAFIPGDQSDALKLAGGSADG